MEITIDKLGRVVLPKKVRDQFHLVPGTRLELEVDGEGVRLVPANQAASLVKKEGILVHHGAGTVDLSIADFINQERENRVHEVVEKREG